MTISSHPCLLTVALLVFPSLVTARFEAFHDLVKDPTKPLPSCATVGISELNDCTEFCTELTEEYDFFRNVNGKTRCYCSVNKICSDAPTCEQILVTPGNVETACGNFCPSTSVMTFEDEVQYAGGISNANKDQTHNKISCSCDGMKACDDWLLFSDLAFLETCEDLGIYTLLSCENHCKESAMTRSASFDSEICLCQGDGGGTATACKDAPRDPTKEDNNDDVPGDGAFDLSRTTIGSLWIATVGLVLLL